MSTKALGYGIAGVAVAAIFLVLGLTAGTQAPAAATAAASAPARKEVERIVHDYLIANPEILGEMQVALEQREHDIQREMQQETIASATDRIFNASYDGVIGNPDGSVTVVEFFDYNCGFCKRAYEDMEAMVAADSDLRFVLKEFPILGPDSQKAHVVSMAFRTLSPERYGEFHRALLVGGARADEDSAILAALELGVDEAALREEMKNPAITRAFAETYELATRLAISGTPSYVIGGEVVFGALGQAVLEEKVELTRSMTRSTN